MKKDFQHHKSRTATMDSIATPDISQIKKLDDPKFRGSGINRTADQIFEGEKFKKRGDFDRATKLYSDPARLKHDHEEEDEDDFIPKPQQNRKAPDALHKGVKIRGAYVERRKVIICVVIMIIALLLMLMFLPPVVSSDSDSSQVLYDRNIFENKGMTEFKTYALSNYSVWNEEAFSSEKPENYRIVNLVFRVSNPTPFEVSIPQYKVSSADALYTDKICYLTSTQTDKDGVVIGDTIPAFSSVDVNAELMVNITDLDDKAFDELVSSLIISTDGMKKRIAVNKYLPCIPAFVFVSNNISLNVDP